jgi:hypothetical protein
VDELDSPGRQFGAAVTFDPSHLAWEADKVSGSAAKTSSLGDRVDISLTGEFQVANKRVM